VIVYRDVLRSHRWRELVELSCARDCGKRFFMTDDPAMMHGAGAPKKICRPTDLHPSHYLVTTYRIRSLLGLVPSLKLSDPPAFISSLASLVLGRFKQRYRFRVNELTVTVTIQVTKPTHNIHHEQIQ
jgi:hypothetical protein